MQIKSQRDFWAGLLFIVLGAGFAWGATLYSFGSSARPGPAYFPFGLGVLLALLGAAILFKAVTVDTADGEPFGDVAWRPLLIITCAVLLFAILLPRAGMVISLPVLVIVSALGSKEFTWTAAIVSSVVLTIFSWLVFIKGLGLTIPLWPVMAAGT
jgi:Tripartite tricarboxylate transporter TctB family